MTASWQDCVSGMFQNAFRFITFEDCLAHIELTNQCKTPAFLFFRSPFSTNHQQRATASSWRTLWLSFMYQFANEINCYGSLWSGSGWVHAATNYVDAKNSTEVFCTCPFISRYSQLVYRCLICNLFFWPDVFGFYFLWCIQPGLKSIICLVYQILKR